MPDPRPILYARPVAGGSLELFRVRRAHGGGSVEEHVTTLFSESAVSEALAGSWVASTGWRDAEHRVIPINDVHDIARLMFEAAVAATAP